MDTSQIISFVASFLIGMFGTYALLDLMDRRMKRLAAIKFGRNYKALEGGND